MVVIKPAKAEPIQADDAYVMLTQGYTTSPFWSLFGSLVMTMAMA